jgi:hypothetical protein
MLGAVGMEMGLRKAEHATHPHPPLEGEVMACGEQGYTFHPTLTIPPCVAGPEVGRFRFRHACVAKRLSSSHE